MSVELSVTSCSLRSPPTLWNTYHACDAPDVRWAHLFSGTEGCHKGYQTNEKPPHDAQTMHIYTMHFCAFLAPSPVSEVTYATRTPYTPQKCTLSKKHCGTLMWWCSLTLSLKHRVAGRVAATSRISVVARLAWGNRGLCTLLEACWILLK
jgi:hypothetical protein